jgi:hypothetical protein
MREEIWRENEKLVEQFRLESQKLRIFQGDFRPKIPNCLARLGNYRGTQRGN